MSSAAAINDAFARTPPPYHAAIFTSRRAPGDHGRDQGYEHHELRVAKVGRAYGKKHTA